jgi:hypothetical protein
VLDHWGGERQAGIKFVTLCSTIPWQADWELGIGMECSMTDPEPLCVVSCCRW